MSLVSCRDRGVLGSPPHIGEERNICVQLPILTLTSATMSTLAVVVAYFSKAIYLSLVGFPPTRNGGHYFLCMESRSYLWSAFCERVGQLLCVCVCLKARVERAKIGIMTFWTLARSYSVLRVLLGLSYSLSSLHTRGRKDFYYPQFKAEKTEIPDRISPLELYHFSAHRDWPFLLDVSEQDEK